MTTDESGSAVVPITKSTSNRLAKSDRPGGKIGIDKLRDYCDKLNEMAWVKASGKPYFIDRKEKGDGTIDYRLERRS